MKKTTKNKNLERKKVAEELKKALTVEMPSQDVVFKKIVRCETSLGTPYARIVIEDITTGKTHSIVAIAEKLDMLKKVPFDDTPVRIKVKEENGYLFLEEVIL